MTTIMRPGITGRTRMLVDTLNTAVELAQIGGTDPEECLDALIVFLIAFGYQAEAQGFVDNDYIWERYKRFADDADQWLT